MLYDVMWLFIIEEEELMHCEIPGFAFQNYCNVVWSQFLYIIPFGFLMQKLRAVLHFFKNF